jgi:hypothetical protein
MMMTMKSLSLYYLCVWFKRFSTSACNECLQLTWELVSVTNCLKGSVDCQGNCDVQEGCWQFALEDTPAKLQRCSCEATNVQLQTVNMLLMRNQMCCYRFTHPWLCMLVVLNLRNFKVDFSCTECHLEQLQLMWNQGPTDPSPMGKACLHKPALTKPSVFSPSWVANW